MFITSCCRFFVISVYSLLHFKNINISSTEYDIRKRFGHKSALGKCARLEQMMQAHTEMRWKSDLNNANCLNTSGSKSGLCGDWLFKLPNAFMPV